MNRTHHQKRKKAQARRASPKAEDAPQAQGGRRRLALLLGCGIVLVCVATYIRFQTESNPQLRIPPVETKDLLPGVAKELQQRQEDILAQPDSAEAWGMYGLVLLAHDFRDQAAICFLDAEKLDGADYRWPYYYGMTMGASDTRKTLEAFQRAVELEPNRITLRLRLAEWLFELRQLDECEQQAQLALRQESDNPRAQMLVARLRFQEGEIEESLTWASRAADSPLGNRRDIHELLARVHTRMGSAAKAAKEVERAEKLPRGVAVWDDPEMGIGGTMMRDASILNALASIHSARGNTELWLKTLRQVVDKEPDNIRAKEKLARALVKLERFDEATSLIDETLKRFPNSSQFECLCGQVKLARGATEAARQCFERATRLKSDYGIAFMWWGRSLVELGRYEEAITALQMAIGLSPSLTDAHDYLGQAFQAEKKYDEAVSAFQDAVDLNPGDLAISMHLAEALVLANRRDEATVILQAIVQTAEDSSEARELLKKLQTPVDKPRHPDGADGTEDSQVD